jgi:6-pyruvoyltetrahydropterin/6-carboxytetrahydropterin synthase
VGRVIDFAVLKARIGEWIERWWDHGFIHHKDDPLIRGAVLDVANGIFRDVNGPDAELKTFALPYNPTAENMARYLLTDVCPKVLAASPVVVVEVTLWETENCYATVRAEDLRLDSFSGETNT